MPTKGEQTRERIVHQSAILLNVRGYAGTSMSDIIEAAGIQKGGIYRHFESKEAIALEACRYVLQQRIEDVNAAVRSEASAIHQLKAVCMSFLDLLAESRIPGGCPILNIAVDADDTNPPLKYLVQEATHQFRSLIQDIVHQGKAQKELPLYINGEVIATILISTCEGALMLSKLYDDAVYLHRAIDHLMAYFETLTP
jgi:AcrR family transcriptional regulator